MIPEHLRYKSYLESSFYFFAQRYHLYFLLGKRPLVFGAIFLIWSHYHSDAFQTSSYKLLGRRYDCGQVFIRQVLHAGLGLGYCPTELLIGHSWGGCWAGSGRAHLPHPPLPCHRHHRAYGSFHPACESCIRHPLVHCGTLLQPRRVRLRARFCWEAATRGAQASPPAVAAAWSWLSTSGVATT